MQRSDVITQQPLLPMPPGPQPGDNWMTAPQNNGCPPGLEYLTIIDKIIVKQRKEMLEIFSGYETANKYVIRNERGEQIYYAFEESGFCMRACCGPKRAYVIHIVDNYQREVMTVKREFKCCAGCNWCAGFGSCQDESTIEAPSGVTVGVVQQRASCCVSAFTILDAQGQKIFEIDGASCFKMSCCGDKEFPIFTMDRQKVGAIKKVWGGMVKESFTDADTFGVNFPMDLDVRMKAALIGATFLLVCLPFSEESTFQDFMEFEKKQNNQNRHTNF